MEFTGNRQQPVWRALFHPTRRQIIQLLQEKSRTTGELSKFFDVTRYAVMKHLRVLEQAELIHVQREGRLRWNVLNQERLRDIPDDYLEQWGAEDESQDGDISSLDYEVTLPVPPDRIYQAFLKDINAWWPDRKLDSSKLVLEPFVGGRFYEAIDDEGAGILFGFISCLEPSREIRLIGPMDAVEAATTSTVRIRFEEEDGRTHLRLSHRTAGEVIDSSLSPYIADWEERLDHHLRAFVTKDSSKPH